MADQSFLGSVFHILTTPSLKKTGWACIASIMHNFFLSQYKAVFFPGRIPITAVDHPLDNEIPFTPSRVTTYMDFSGFWVRTADFLLAQYGARAEEPVRNFIESIGNLYKYAGEVYTKNLSTTDRPRYYGRFKFILIHATDPHLMCIPSLHVMVVIHTYTMFRNILTSLGETEAQAERIEAVRKYALDITESILYVKQHSVNCISATMYAMTRLDGDCFPQEEAEDFVSRLFTDPPSPPRRDEIRTFLIERYRAFLEMDKDNPDWKSPLLTFLTNPDIFAPVGAGQSGNPPSVGDPGVAFTLYGKP
ncbi:hypothetical protein FACS189493_0280 [Spirochaetia bacterium]|nr:hypothetical protein FACS189493_0280 [Spirochaetia bacterium]